MDITAKHAAPDKDGVRIAELDEESFRYLLWDHKPLTDFWMTGPGTVKRLEKHGIYTMGELAYFSTVNQDILYKEFGVDAELLIDHAWGLEPCGMKGKPNYEVRLDSLPQRLQYQYLYSHLPESDICALDLVSPRSVLGNAWLDEFLDISSLIRSVALIRQQHHSTGHITGELRKLADSHGISLATLYRLIGKPSSAGISSLYTDPFYLQNHLPNTMCLWSCDLAYALYLDSENTYSQDDIMAELHKMRNSVLCSTCPYHPDNMKNSDIPACSKPQTYMPVPNHRKTVNRLLHHIPPQMVLYARKGYREWRAQYGLFVMRDRPLLVNESWQGDHHKFDLFVRITIHREHHGKVYEKEIAVRPTLTAWMK